jgi:trk system potassium uptake protein TrkH
MNRRAVINVISLLLMIFCTGMLASAIVSACCASGTKGQVEYFFLSAFITFLPGFLGFFFTRRRRGESEFKTGLRDGFCAVAFAWLIAIFLGSLPFYLIGKFRLVDAIFETASGLTTTGASVIDSSLALRNGQTLSGGLESLPTGLLFWRSLLNWFGGVGIVFFVLLVLPLLNLGKGSQLYNAEMPGLKTSDDRLTPRLKSSVHLLIGIYLLLTLLATALYCLGGMTLFEAVCHAFSTVSTGGFSTRAESFGAFPSPFLQWSAIAMMFLCSCNFALTIRLFTERHFVFHKDEEFRFYTIQVLCCILLVFIVLLVGKVLPVDGEAGVLKQAEQALRAACFQVVSLSSTTGFSNCDYVAWNLPVTLVLFTIVMIPCGCGGSTAGGLKISRLLLLLKGTAYEIKHCLFPHTLRDIRLNGHRVDDGLLNKTMAFAQLYFFLFLIGTALLVCLNLDLKTSFSASLSCIGNIGPAFGTLGPACSYGWLPAIAKYVLAILMLVGRLELYTIFVLFLPSFWKR